MKWLTPTRKKWTSMLLQSMENGRAGVSASTTGSILKTLSLVTIVTLGFLIGQVGQETGS
jgi:hypothetical protein